MRLLNTTTYRLQDFNYGKVPKYAIVSHRWTDEEITHQDYRKNRGRELSGYRKVIHACNFAKSRSQEWLWIDTCCIDKKSAAELDEAINSMFDWYREAEECYAYLFNVRSPSRHHPDIVEDDFRKSDWFRRGWTLQELLAPSLVIFCASNWEVIGFKGTFPTQTTRDVALKVSLNSRIEAITGIPEDLLGNPLLVRRRSVAQILSWAAGRKTTKVEDQAYCLLGLLGVHMPLMYGDPIKGFVRIQEEILCTLLDETLLAWTYNRPSKERLGMLEPGLSSPFSGVLAESPTDFALANHVEGFQLRPNPRFTLSHGLLEFRPDEFSEMFEVRRNTIAITLRCADNTVSVASARVNDKHSHSSFALALTMRPCGHFDREHGLEDLVRRRDLLKKVVPGVIYMHTSTENRCRELAAFTPTSGGAQRRRS